MELRTIRRALLSVSDKTGLVDFARELVTKYGVELIATGGTVMIRAAAKNFNAVAVVTQPDQDAGLLEELAGNGGQTTPEWRRWRALEAFTHVSRYDAAISAHFSQMIGERLGATGHISRE